MKRKTFKHAMICVFLIALSIISASLPSFASSSKIRLSDVTVTSKSNGASADNLVIDGDTIRGDILLPKQDDFIELDLSLSNESGDDYTIDSVSDNYDGEYLQIDYSYGPTVPADSKRTIHMRISYIKQVINRAGFSIDDIMIVAELTSSNGASEKIIVNPTTSDKLPFYLGILVASLAIIAIAIRRLKKTMKIGIIAAIILLCSPLLVFAAEKYEFRAVIEMIVLGGEFEEYDVVIDPDDGSEPIIRTVKYGDKIGELPNASTRTGYNSDGWKDEDDNEVTPETIITRPITIKPKYTYNGYTVSFDANGGNGEMSRQIFDLNTSTRLNENGFVRAGYEFKGWNTMPDGSGDDYIDRQQVSFANTGEMTLYAKWFKLEATLANGRTVNTKLNQLSTGATTGGAYNSTNRALKHFIRSETKPVESNMTSRNIISNSAVPIYAWAEDETVYWWTEDIDPSFNQDCYDIFAGFSALEELDLSDFDTYKVTNMHRMFAGLSSLTSLNLGENFDTSKVTEMYEMFYGMTNLKSLDLGDKFDTSNVTVMRNMFYGMANLTSLDLGDKFDTGKVGEMYGMFYGMTGLTSLNLGENFDTRNAYSMVIMFSGLTSLESLDLGGKFDTSHVNSMIRMFEGSSGLKEIIFGDKFDTGNVTNMYEMFKGCSSLTSLDLGDNFNTGKVTDMTSMFSGLTSLESLDLGNKFDTSSVTKMASMFNEMSNLASLDLGENFDTGNVVSTGGMFAGMRKLASLDLGEKFDTKNVVGMGEMFQNMTSLTSLDLGAKFDTSNVTGMSFMFSNVSSLTSLDLGDKFDTGSVTFMWSMFENMSSLTSLDLGNKFDTSNVTVMRNMFYGMTNLTSLDLGDKFDTSNVWDMRAMFMKLSSLTSLDLGDRFYTTSIQTMDSIFRSCGNLVTIYASEAFDATNVKNGSQIFQDDYNLVGGAGTTYDSRYAYSGLAQAHIDGGESNPGYFTARP